MSEHTNLETRLTSLEISFKHLEVKLLELEESVRNIVHAYSILKRQVENTSGKKYGGWHTSGEQPREYMDVEEFRDRFCKACHWTKKGCDIEKVTREFCCSSAVNHSIRVRTQK